MSWWQNIPFFLVWGPLLLSSITAVLKPKQARAMMLIVPAAGTIASTALLVCLLKSGGESFRYALGAFGAPFGNELRAGALEAALAVTFCLILFLCVLGGYQRIRAHIETRRQSLYAVMVLLLESGMMAQLFTNDVFTAYVFIEIMTIAAGSLVMARTRGRTLFAATRYMIMNLLGSGLFLLGISILYCLTGHLLMEDINDQVLTLYATGAYARPLTLSMALITIGLAVKSALYPFHTWLPDAYASATPSSSAMLASLVAPLFASIGFGDWRIATAILTGVMAKESVVSTISILFGSTAQVAAVLSPAGALSLLVFCLLYTPCVAAIASIKRELGGRWAAAVVVMQCVIAWIVAFITFLAASVLNVM